MQSNLKAYISFAHQVCKVQKICFLKNEKCAEEEAGATSFQLLLPTRRMWCKSWSNGWYVVDSGQRIAKRIIISYRCGEFSLAIHFPCNSKSNSRQTLILQHSSKQYPGKFISCLISMFDVAFLRPGMLIVACAVFYQVLRCPLNRTFYSNQLCDGPLSIKRDSTWAGKSAVYMQFSGPCRFAFSISFIVHWLFVFPSDSLFFLALISLEFIYLRQTIWAVLIRTETACLWNWKRPLRMRIYVEFIWLQPLLVWPHGCLCRKAFTKIHKFILAL